MVLAALAEMMFPFFLAQEQELELELELSVELLVELWVQLPRRLLDSGRLLLLPASL